MAKGSDLIGRSGAGGLGSPKPGIPLKPQGEVLGDKGKKFDPPKDARPAKGGKEGSGGVGAAPTSVRPKV
jgi:hypothetical protein